MNARKRTKFLTVGTLLVSFGCAYFINGQGESAVVQNAITFIGILFGIIAGFYIADLYTRYSTIRSNAAADASALSTFYFFCEIIAGENKDTSWLDRTKDRIEAYIHAFMPLGWDEYGKTEDAFAKLGDSLKEVKYSDSDKANESFSNVLNVYNGHSNARENLIMAGKDKLSLGEWIILIILGTILLVCVFYLNDNSSLVSLLFTGAVSSAVLMLFAVLLDLNNLNFSEQEVSVEPYERVLDTIGRRRYYGNKHNHKELV